MKSCGMTKKEFGYVLSMLKKIPSDLPIIELGCHKGALTLPLSIYAKGTVYAVDKKSYANIDYPNVTAVISDSVKFLKGFKEQAGFIFLDTSHTYEQTRKEILASYEVLTDGGILALHDSIGFTYPGVACAIEEIVFDKFEVIGIKGSVFFAKKKKSPRNNNFMKIYYLCYNTVYKTMCIIRRKK